MADVRDAIQQEIRTTPGIHFNALVRKLDLAPGQVQHHIKRLTSMDAVVAEPCWGRTHYYPSGIEKTDRRALAVLHRETSKAILKTILTNGPCTPERLATELDIARSTLEYHLERMIEVELVEKKRGIDGNVTLSVVDGERAEFLIAVVDPVVFDRLSDRFERLLDQLLER